MMCFFTSISIAFAKESSIQNLKFKLESKKYSNYDRSYFADSLLLHYRKTNPDSALFFARKMYSLVINDTSQNNIDYCVTHLGSLHRIIGNLDSSIFYYKIALESYQKRKYEEGIASIYNNLATVYKTQNRYDLAIKNYLEALEILKNSKRYNARGNMYSNFAGLYFKLENYEKSKEYWQLAEKDFKRENSQEITHCWRGYAKLEIENKNFTNANKWLSKAEILDEKNKIDVFIIEDKILRMQIWQIQKDEISFPKKWTEAEHYIHDLDIPVLKAKYYEIISNYLLDSKSYKLSEVYLDSGLNIVKNEFLPEEELKMLKTKLMIHLHSGASSNDFNLLYQINDLELKVSKIKNERITQETDARYSLKDKEEKIRILDEKNKVANDLIESEKELALQSKRQILWMWIGIGLFFGFILYVLFTNRKLKATQKELQKNIEQKDFLFRELNHRVKNNLHIVSSFLSIESHGKPEEVKEILLTCENRIHSLGLVHEMLYQGEISENIELKFYFEKLVRVIRETLSNNQTEIISNIQNELKLHSNKTVLLGLIANELITNAIKYAKSPERNLIIQLEIKTVGDKIQMKISDNGIGFHESSHSKNSLGMKLAKGLTRQLNGDFSCENKDEGVEFRVKF